MITARDIDDIIGAEAVDQDNDRIGKVGQVYLDSESDEPTWVSVKSGLFGTSETLVPLNGADWDRSSLHLAFSKDRVKDAPRVEPDAELSPEEQDRLYDYYGITEASASQGADGGANLEADRIDDSAAGVDRDRTDPSSAGLGQDRTDAVDRDASTGGAAYDSDTDATYTDASTTDAAAGTGAGTMGAAYGDTTDADRTATTDDLTGRDTGYSADADDQVGRHDARRDDADLGAAGMGAAGASGVASDRDTSTTADYAGLDADRDRTVGHDTSGPTTDDAMTRSEERLNVGTERVETGRARLRKYVVTEQQTVTVPTTREEVRLEREPITDANRGDAYDGADLSEEEHEVVLTEERPVVEKETVPVERVRLTTDEVTDEQQVTEDVRHEEVTEDDGRGTDDVRR